MMKKTNNSAAKGDKRGHCLQYCDGTLPSKLLIHSHHSGCQTAMKIGDDQKLPKKLINK